MGHHINVHGDGTERGADIIFNQKMRLGFYGIASKPYFEKRENGSHN
jgi:hypothetical protein